MATASPLDALFQQALQLHQQGDLSGASALYLSILEQDAGHFDALHLLGVIAAQSGDPARAVDLIGRALVVDATQAQAQFHRALALRDLGRHEEALLGFNAVLALDPRHVDAWLGQADSLRDLQRNAEAVENYTRAIEVQPDNAQALFARGVLQQQLLRGAPALADYERVLLLQPEFPGAVINRALVLQTMGRHEQALAGFEHLLRLVPGHAPALLGRGQCMAALGRLDQARTALDQALAAQPDLHEVSLERGRVLRGLQQDEAALAQFEKLLAAAPDHAVAWFEHGTTAQRLHRDAQALASLERALALHPRFGEAWANRALALLALERKDEALAAAGQAIEISPALADAHYSRGLVLSRMQRHGEALESYDRALALRADHAESHGNRGHELEVLLRLPEALAAYDRALALAPRHPDYLYGRGAVLQLLRRDAEALDCYDQVLALAPDHESTLANRGSALRVLRRPAEAARAYARLLEAYPEHPYAMGNRLHAQLHACDWSGWGDVTTVCNAVRAGKPADQPFHLLALSDSTALQQQCARLYGAQTHAQMAPLWRGERYQHARIRLAYISGDFDFHPVSHLIAELLEAHDRRRFEVTAISLRPPGQGTFDRRIQATFEHYVDASAMGDMEIARLLYEREIDIAVDLMGYTNMTRAGIFAHRPAPVQAAYLGYAGTLGLPYMDYLIADDCIVPAATAQYYDEKVVHLPASFMPRDTSAVQLPAPARAAAGLPGNGFVFCCFNNAYKLNPPVFEVWMRLLRAVPESVLWLSDPGTEVRENLLREAQQRGVPAARIVFAPKTPGIAEHLARLPLADLFLDTFPYNAHTTASDALWAGLPVLTYAGEAFASRVAASLLTAAGLPELITHDLAGYEALALRLARTPAQLAPMRAQLRDRRAAGELFNTERLRMNMENAFERMVERSRQGLPPAGFAVAA